MTIKAEEMTYHGCLTGDCPHDTQAECDKSLADAYREIAAQPADDTWELLAKAYTAIGSLDDFEEAKKDRARLDWMMGNGAKVDESNSSAEDGTPWLCRYRTFHTSFQGEMHYFYGSSARDAIDKAMARQ